MKAWWVGHWANTGKTPVGTVPWKGALTRRWDGSVFDGMDSLAVETITQLMGTRCLKTYWSWKKQPQVWPPCSKAPADELGFLTVFLQGSNVQASATSHQLDGYYGFYALASFHQNEYNTWSEGGSEDQILHCKEFPEALSLFGLLVATWMDSF